MKFTLHVVLAHIYSKATAEKPTTASAKAALLLCLITPLVGFAAGTVLDALEALAEEELVVLLAVALAAAWKAAKVLFSVGLTANTIPCAQCLNDSE